MATNFITKLIAGSSDAARPTLHLSGPQLVNALERLLTGSETHGGVEIFSEALKLKAGLFHDLIGEGKAANIGQADFEQLVPFMATVRRRFAMGVDGVGYRPVRAAIAELIANAEETSQADQNLGVFIKTFPTDKTFRWVRDLGAEILHALFPEQYPLMTRWVWDAKANSGVLREIWHGDNVDHMIIDVADDYAAHVMLREELSQFLSDNGVFRDMLVYVDLLMAQVYGDYINSQGGTYLRTDFSTESDPLEHVRRILGLDGVSPKTGRTKFKTIDGSAHVIADSRLLS